MCNLRIKNLLATVVFVLVLTGTTHVLAATRSTTDSTWSYYSNDGTGYTSYRTKDKVGNVYCYPKKGDSSVYVTVGMKITSKSDPKAASKKVKLNRGTEYTIINSAEKGNYVRLRFDTCTYTYGTNSGVWSPDATRDYEIVGD